MLERERDWALLMGAAVDGDLASYRQLLGSLAATLRQTVRRGCERARVGNADVEDIVQDILLAIHLKRHTWRRDDPIGPWIAAISRNKLIDALRRRGRRAEMAADDLLDTLPASEETVWAVTPVLFSRASTAAPATAASLASSTVPDNDPV